MHRQLCFKGAAQAFSETQGRPAPSTHIHLEVVDRLGRELAMAHARIAELEARLAIRAAARDCD